MACSTTDIGQGTATPITEIDPTLTTDPSTTELEPTSIPEPAAGTHTWHASPVLISMQDSPGLVDYHFAWSLGPDLIVYADGRVIAKYWTNRVNRTFPSYQIGQMSQTELCNLLVQIDDFGFFNLTRDDYFGPTITDAESTKISVNAWESNSFSAYGLWYAINYKQESGVSVPPALEETYHLLMNLEVATFMQYQPDQVSLLIEPLQDASAEIWPTSLPSLRELASEESDYPEALIEGEDAAKIYELFQDSDSRFFIDDETSYRVTYRPLFPYEIYSEMTGWGRLSEFESTPRVDMNCSNQISAVQNPTFTNLTQ